MLYLAREDMEPDLERRRELMEGLVRRVSHLGLVTPAIAFLEANKPLSFVGSQMLLALQPLLAFFGADAAIQEYALLLQERQNIEELLELLEKER